MSELFHLFSIRLGGWQTNGGVYTSDTNQAKLCTREEALKLCRKQRGGITELGLVPVPVQMIKEILE